MESLFHFVTKIIFGYKNLFLATLKIPDKLNNSADSSAPLLKDIRSSNNTLPHLAKLISKHFSQEELRVLCFYIDVEFEDLVANGKSSQAVELVEHCHRHKALQKLLETCKEINPKAPWPREISISTTADSSHEHLKAFQLPLPLFVIFNFFIGVLIVSFLPREITIENYLLAAFATIMFWIIVSIMIDGVFRLVSNKELSYDSISIILRLLSIAYLVSACATYIIIPLVNFYGFNSLAETQSPNSQNIVAESTTIILFECRLLFFLFFFSKVGRHIYNLSWIRTIIACLAAILIFQMLNIALYSQYPSIHADCQTSGGAGVCGG